VKRSIFFGSGKVTIRQLIEVPAIASGISFTAASRQKDMLVVRSLCDKMKQQQQLIDC